MAEDISPTPHQFNQVFLDIVNKMEADEKELKELREFKAKVTPALRHIYEIFFWDGDQGLFDPNKEWKSAPDFLDMIHDEIVAILPEPEKGTIDYPTLIKEF